MRWRIWHDRNDVAAWTLAYPEFPSNRVGPPPCDWSAPGFGGYAALRPLGDHPISGAAQFH